MQTPAPGEPTQSAQPVPPPPPGPPPGYAAAPYGSPAAGWSGPPPQQTVAGPAAGLAYAGFWWRVLAVFVDWILLGIIFFIGGRTFVKGIDYGNGNIVITEGQWWWAVWGIVSFLYLPVTWAWLGETIGHRMFGMEIRRVEDGARPGIGQIIVRWIGYYISSIILGIGFLIAAFDPRKQGLHDKLASTVVVRKVA
ncbi:MAG TPA: RDD family protein [Candidatus Angelobacter sp.]|jgi:uncharacterized RDD family membrane protein YckC|nr:RDD family protein [Candidatus Angelobacter sp.]